jgi:hypothetical protein
LNFLAIISFLLRKSWIETFLQTCSRIFPYMEKEYN